MFQEVNSLLFISFNLKPYLKELSTDVGNIQSKLAYFSLYLSNINTFLTYLYFTGGGGYTFYYKKYSKEDLFMWWSMHKNFILLHIRSVNFRVKFVEISDHVSKLIFYYIENLILLHYESLTDFDPKKCSKMKFSM